MPKTLTTFKFNQDLLDWLKEYAAAHGTSKTAIVEDLLYAAREGRIRVVERSGPNAFPGEGEIAAGETPDHPILVAPSTRDQVGEPVRGWFMQETVGIGLYGHEKLTPCEEVPSTDNNEDPEKHGGES